MDRLTAWLSTEQAGANVGMTGEWVRRQIVAGRLRATAFDTGRRRTYRIRAETGRPFSPATPGRRTTPTGRE